MVRRSVCQGRARRRGRQRCSEIRSHTAVGSTSCPRRDSSQNRCRALSTPCFRSLTVGKIEHRSCTHVRRGADARLPSKTVGGGASGGRSCCASHLRGGDLARAPDGGVNATPRCLALAASARLADHAMRIWSSRTRTRTYTTAAAAAARRAAHSSTRSPRAGFSPSSCRSYILASRSLVAARWPRLCCIAQRCHR